MTEKSEKVNESQIDFLKPCLCGTSVQPIVSTCPIGPLAPNEYWVHIRCPSCGWGTPYVSSVEKAVAEWNGRVKKMPDIIDLGKFNPYQTFENYLYDLYFAQKGKNGVCNYCMGDLLVVWGLAYDLADLEKMLETGGSAYPTLFKHNPTDDERWEQHRIFYNVDDWCEGERWAAVFAVYSLPEIYHDPSINGFKGRPMKLLGRDDRWEKE